MTPTLFIANKNYSSWSLRPWVLLHEVGIPFEERLVLFGSEEWSSYRQQLRTVPSLIDGEIVVWDSLAIAEYLAEQHPGVWPEDAAARAWARSAAAEMHSSFSALRNDCPMNCGVVVQLNAISDALQRDIDRFDALWQEGLSRFGGPFLAGASFTAVDAFYAPVAFRVRSFQLQLSPASTAYVERLLQLPAMVAWDQAGIAEDAREVEHEREIEGLGNILEDRRVPARETLHL